MTIPKSLMEKLRELALDVSNSIEPIKDIDCPRNVVNPGLYFGVMKGAEAYHKLLMKTAPSFDFDEAFVEAEEYCKKYPKSVAEHLFIGGKLRHYQQSQARESALRAENEELQAFKKEWVNKDGNSPGYNLQKARNYGEKAREFKLKCDELEARCAKLEQRIAELEEGLDKRSNFRDRLENKDGLQK